MHRKWSLSVIIALMPLFFTCCTENGERKAKQMCARAAELEKTDAAKSIAITKKMWEELPTTGTSEARRCGKAFRKKMGLVRSMVHHDKRGDEETIAGCEWVAESVKAFQTSVHPPFRMHWAIHLLRDCKQVLGRAWAREPDSARYLQLDEQMDKLLPPENR